ncbi:leptin receptor gene-related protein [Chrysoperla carnea]|uniref:leptin receptor gene-related protein n=1 Tax=Chrysoperla carnea TaxID=189513 RepID=UPI001D075586|nr:leptin receptor gene-related protein [Chrysoperla carnea]
MAGVKGLVGLAFLGSIGMTLVILACALPENKLWWPFFVVVFYLLAPLPTLIARRYNENPGGSNSTLECAIFITMGIVISAFALVIVLARAEVIRWTACYLTLTGNVIVFATLIGFFLTFDSDDSDYTMW